MSRWSGQMFPIHTSHSGVLRRNIISERVVCAALSAIIFWLGFTKFSAPLPTLVNYFLPDDAFYYFQTARNFANTGFSSFDGLHFTNGYHPLWLLICTPIFWLFPHGGAAPIYVILWIQLLLYLISAWILFLSLSRMFGWSASAIAISVWTSCTFNVATNGLETAVLGLMYSCVFAFWQKAFAARGSRPGYRDHLALGVLCGLLFLARTDSFFLVGFISVGIAFHRIWVARSWRNFIGFATPIAILAGVYLSINYWKTGHFMPVSGAAKEFYSTKARELALKSEGTAAVYLNNVKWAFTERSFHYLMSGLILPPTMILISLYWRKNLLLRQIRSVWPFAASAWCAFLFYGVAFYGNFTRTNWYYIPQTTLAAVGVAAFSALFSKAHRRPAFAALAALIPVGFIGEWGIGYQWAPVAAAGISLILLLATARGSRLRRAAGWGVPCALVLFAAIHPFSLQFALFVIFVAAFAIIDLTCRWSISSWLSAPAAIAFLYISLSPVQKYIQNIARAEPKNWNYNLYMGAIWARDNLPVGATIWSNSTGIIGYFSGHPSVNTDGLINSYEYLDKFLKGGRAYEYMRKWDYTIDALPDKKLEEIFPGGHFVELPAELQKAPFADGALTRVLMIYKMPERPKAEASTP